MWQETATTVVLACLLCGMLVYAYSVQTYQLIATTGTVTVFASEGEGNIGGHIFATGQIGGLSCALLIDTGFSGPVVLNITSTRDACDRTATGHVDETRRAEELFECAIRQSDPMAFDMSATEPLDLGDGATQRMLYARGIRMGPVRKSQYIGIDGSSEMSEAYATALLSLDGSNGAAPVAGRNESVQVMAIEGAPCILTLDYLVRRRRCALDLREHSLPAAVTGAAAPAGRLAFGEDADALLEGLDVVFPEQKVSGGVVMWRVWMGATFEGATDDWLIVDTGFCHALSVRADVGARVNDAGACCDGSTFIEQYDVFGNPVCHRVARASAWIAGSADPDDPPIPLCGAGSTTVLVRESDEGPAGLIGLSVLRGAILVFDTRWRGSVPRIGLVAWPGHKSCATVSPGGGGGQCAQKQSFYNATSACSRCPAGGPDGPDGPDGPGGSATGSLAPRGIS